MQTYYFTAVIEFETDQHRFTADAAIFDTDALGNIDQQGNGLAAMRTVLANFLNSFSHIQLDYVRSL